MNPSIRIRPAVEQDYPFILKLNDENVEVLSPMDLNALNAFAETASVLWIAEYDQHPAGFIIALRESVPSYQSENYRWFCTHFDRFLYIDRIVIDEPYRHCEIGCALYRSIFEKAVQENIPRVTAEIDTIPYNAVSLSFHSKMGFHEVGTQYVRNNTIRVSLQVADIS